jgi:hypothetical protein
MNWESWFETFLARALGAFGACVVVVIILRQFEIRVTGADLSSLWLGFYMWSLFFLPVGGRRP